MIKTSYLVLLIILVSILTVHVLYQHYFSIFIQWSYRRVISLRVSIIRGIHRCNTSGDQRRLTNMKLDVVVLGNGPDLYLLEGLMATRIARFTHVDIFIRKSLKKKHKEFINNHLFILYSLKEKIIHNTYNTETNDLSLTSGFSL